MSNLHQAVQAEIAAHTPTLPPSFDALKARKRARDRRRTGAAVAVSALAVVGIAFVPSAVLSGDNKVPAQVAQPGDTEVFGFAIRATDVTTAINGGVGRCLDLPGLGDVFTQTSNPATHAGTVTGRDNADALTDCVEAVPGWGVTLMPVEAVSGEFVVTYADPANFDGNALSPCESLSGASPARVPPNPPPRPKIGFEGTASEKEQVEACLRGIQGVSLTFVQD